LAPILADTGWRVSYCDASTEDLSDRAIASADLLIVLGGPIGVFDTSAFRFLSKEIELLERDHWDMLGSQLMAKASHARIRRPV
jgi:GMP synthase (glutamine-hydrolysing)